MLKNTLVILLILAFLGFAIGFTMETTRRIPDHARVMVDDEVRTYYAPAYAPASPKVRETTAGEARSKGYSPDSQSRNNGAFEEKGRSLSETLLERMGWLEPLPSRWNPDGSWKP